METRQQPAEAGLVYGRNAVAEVLKSRRAADVVYILDGMPERQAAYFIALAREAGAVVKRVHAAKLDALCGAQTHQGVAARAAQIEYVTLDAVLAAARAAGEDPLLVLCDGVEDPHNLGAIVRSALLCGAHGVVIPRRGGASVTPTVLKSSAGAAARLPIARVANIGETIRRLKKENIFVYCADLDGRPVREERLDGPLALVVGGEGAGVSPLVRKLCDGAVSLAMSPRGSGVDSFNVSVAAGILLYEIMAQRARKEGRAQ